MIVSKCSAKPVLQIDWNVSRLCSRNVKRKVLSASKGECKTRRSDFQFRFNLLCSLLKLLQNLGILSQVLFAIGRLLQHLPHEIGLQWKLLVCFQNREHQNVCRCCSAEHISRQARNVSDFQRHQKKNTLVNF